MSPFVLILFLASWQDGGSVVAIDMPSEAVCNLNKGNAEKHYRFLKEAECMRRELPQ